MMCSKPTARLFYCLSLLLAVVAAAGQFEAYSERLRRANNADSFESAVREMPAELRNDPNFDAWQAAPGDARWRDSRSKLIKAIEAKSALLPSRGKVQSASATAKEILDGVAFRDRGVGQSRNWLSRVFERIAEYIQEILERIFGNRDLAMPNLPAPSPILGALTPIVWGLIGAAVIAFVVFVIRKFRLGPKKKKVGGLMEEDEPERTADEWLVRADELASQGRHREAVRCLYLACLVRFDDANVARFVRSETNWEHLHRIQASPRRPESVDFRPPTEKFDRIWYGHGSALEAEVAEFRNIYEKLCRDLNLHRAA